MTARSTAYLILSLLLFESAQASTYYVKPGGSDTKDGLSWANAWQTVAKVNASMKGGDTCFFGPGTYTPSHLIPASGGSAGDWTAYISGDGVSNNPSFGAAQLSGGDSLPQTGWSLYSGNIYSHSWTPTKAWPSQRGASLDVAVASQGDSMLSQGGGAGSLSQGQFYYDYNARVLYVYCYNIDGRGVNPANYGIWTGSDVAIDFSNNYNGGSGSSRSSTAQYVAIVGFKVRNCQMSGVFLGWADASHCLISHCDVQMIGQYGNNNGDCIGSRTTYTAPGGYGNTIRACTIKKVTGSQRYGTDFYSQTAMTVESCYVDVGRLMGGIYFKGAGWGSSDSCVIRYNTIVGATSGDVGAITSRGTMRGCHVYGNVFKTTGGWAYYLGVGDGASSPPAKVVFENNTIYGASAGLVIGLNGSMGVGDSLIIRRNVFYSAGSDALYLICASQNQIRADSNIIYSISGNIARAGGGYSMPCGNQSSLTGWRSCSPTQLRDPVSATYNPFFDAASVGNNTFSRSTSAVECNATLPDGKVVRLYGAWQPGGMSPLNWIQADSVRGDYSGESDSLRLRTLTSTQTSADSVIYALSMSGVLPTFGQSLDRWAKRYPGASRYDTLYVIKQITEPDTVIVGAWAKSVDSGYSAGVYDTLILHGPPVQTPLPLNYVQIDSIRSDFSGENDSLRVRFQTQSQTGNDSVVMAISLTGALPTVNSADRWAKGYVASNTDTSFIIRQIVETDTIIVGGWVKRGTVWSPGKYDTLIVRAAPPQTPLPLNYVQIDSIRSDFSGENDSLRVRFQTQSQTGNDSVVMAISLNNSLPTATSTDRWASGYIASKTDTSFIIRQITETDTIIIGGWVKAGSIWSTARYDTLILSQPPPDPVLSIAIDSVNYDYYGESDSLRFHYQTGSQTGPDSVIVALSLTSALPTTSSTDRWARRYNANADLTFFGTKLINEPDTVIVGAWVKEGSAYSAPVYDTIALTPPLEFADVASNDVTSSSATVNWETNLLATSQVEYGPDTTYGYATTRDANKVKNHTVVVTGLEPAREYHFRVVSDPGNGPKKSSDTTFLTSLSTGGQLLISGEDTNEVTDSSITVVWTSSSPATSQVEYGTTTSYGVVTPVDQALNSNHLVFVNGLAPRTRYHWRVISVDQFGNRAVGSDHLTRTANSNQQNIARHKPPKASSSQPGYSPGVATDTVIDPYGGSQTIWMCNNNTTQAQWIELDLGIDSVISKVVVYWAWDSNNTTWTTSQEYSIQRWNGVGFDDILWVTNPTVDAATVTSFPGTVYASKIRIYQPPRLGPIDQPNTLALTEIEVYGIAGTPQDTTGLVSASATVSIVAQPLLTVNNFTDSDTNRYYFEIARDSALQQTVATSGAVSQQSGLVTTWKVPEPLTPGQTYFWRVVVNQLIYSAVHSIMVLPQTHPYPNPFKLGNNGEATFTAVPAGSNLVILSVSGDIVKRWTNNTGDDIIWDGRNESGNLVAPGTYLWFVENTQIKGKLIVLY